MKSILYIFKSIIESTSIKDKSFPNIVEDKFLIKMNKISSGTQGETFLTKFFSNIEIILKTIKSNSESEAYIESLREYFIGYYFINNLRYKIPNYVYTLGIFSLKKNNKSSVYVAYEKIQGTNFYKSTLDEQQFLECFIQLLIALEVGQREIGFCHFDLHYENIILRKIKKSIRI